MSNDEMLKLATLSTLRAEVEIRQQESKLEKHVLKNFEYFSLAND